MWHTSGLAMVLTYMSIAARVRNFPNPLQMDKTEPMRSQASDSFHIDSFYIQVCYVVTQDVSRASVNLNTDENVQIGQNLVTLNDLQGNDFAPPLYIMFACSTRQDALKGIIGILPIANS